MEWFHRLSESQTGMKGTSSLIIAASGLTPREDMVPSTLSGMLSSVCNDRKQTDFDTLCANLPKPKPSKLFPLPQERQSGRLLSPVSSRALHYVFHFMSDKESLTQSAGFVSQAELGRADRREKCHRVCSVLSERERIIHYRSSCICADRVDPPQRSMPGQSAYFLPVHKQRWQNEICGFFFLP